MCLSKLLKIYHKYRGRLKRYFSNVIAGIFAGVPIGIFFELVTDITFNRWINLFSLEIIPFFIYLIFISIVLIVSFLIGGFFIYLVYYFHKQKKEIFIDYYINFVSGIYSGIYSFLFVLYFNQPVIRNTLAFSFIIFFFISAYSIIKVKKLTKLFLQ